MSLIPNLYIFFLDFVFCSFTEEPLMSIMTSVSSMEGEEREREKGREKEKGRVVTNMTEINCPVCKSCFYDPMTGSWMECVGTTSVRTGHEKNKQGS